MAGELVEKGAVVGNKEDGAGILAEVFLEPLQGLQVEMVGRLVEHQQVGRLHQKAGQVGAHDPAAAHFAQGTVEILFAEAQAGEDLLGTGFELIAAQLASYRAWMLSWRSAACRPTRRP